MADYTYCRTRWNHGLQTYPVEFWSELDEFRFEIRLIEVYPDGHMRWASPTENTGADTRITPLPELAEMADDPECAEATVITAEEFEAQWARRKPPAP